MYNNWAKERCGFALKCDMADAGKLLLVLVSVLVKGLQKLGRGPSSATRVTSGLKELSVLVSISKGQV